ncbi:hypothetical protein N2599_23715 (plasmid) [Rhizobium sullae]|uniref:Uncharacterized protein n=1 Tax=Rhizobium sullae TaxID=50338 RepID=A0ABY5XVR8_RHISU|nr:hypothetical protein [Rhizobium sullae]UWU18264.1 hypothetical protein N2599_23715 [Rhizobium sullae]
MTDRRVKMAVSSEADESKTRRRVLQFMTTEHFVLQTARAATIQEANQRANLFLTSVSSATIALAFVAQVTDMGHARGIARIRHYYIEVAPLMEKYLVHSTHDDDKAVLSDRAGKQSRWQSFMSTAGVVSVIAGGIAGVFAGVVVKAIAGLTVTVSGSPGNRSFRAKRFPYAALPRSSLDNR